MKSITSFVLFYFNILYRILWHTGYGETVNHKTNKIRINPNSTECDAESIAQLSI